MRKFSVSESPHTAHLVPFIRLLTWLLRQAHPSLPLPSLFIMMLEFELRAATHVRQELGP